MVAIQFFGSGQANFAPFDTASALRQLTQDDEVFFSDINN
jgi:hypothetical protein